MQEEFEEEMKQDPDPDPDPDQDPEKEIIIIGREIKEEIEIKKKEIM